MIRLGLCCVFKSEPIKFSRTTATFQYRFDRNRQLENLSSICRRNAESLFQALTYCHANRIGDFRINSQILPLKTHPDCGYDIKELPDHDSIIKTFQKCGALCIRNNIRTTFHPDQFILLSSPDPAIVSKSLNDLIYQAEVAEWVGADVINLHGGGAYGDKKSALKRLAGQIDKLPDVVRSRLTLENDDRVYTPEDLFPVCRDLEIPMVYDVHHHRCLNDGISIEKTTDAALKTWNREPVFHLSSPLNGWNSKKTGPHHDYIDPQDFPECWLPSENVKNPEMKIDVDITIEIEAKAKELAIFKLIKDLEPRIILL